MSTTTQLSPHGYLIARPSSTTLPLPAAQSQTLPAVIDPLATRERIDCLIRSNPRTGKFDPAFKFAGLLLGGVSAVLGGALTAVGLTTAGAAPAELAVAGATATGVLAGAALFFAPWLKGQRADAVLSKGIVSVLNELPSPEARGTDEARIVLAQLATKAPFWGRTLSSEAKALLEALQSQTQALDERLRTRVTTIVASLMPDDDVPWRASLGPWVRLILDDGAPPGLVDVDALAAVFSTMDAGERSRILALLQPLVNKAVEHCSTRSPWRAQALAAALDGKSFRYSDLLSETEAPEYPALHPNRLRMEEMEASIEKTLRGHASAAIPHARVWLPRHATHAEALRLAAKYEALGYSAFLHPRDGGVVLTLCPAEHVPTAKYIEGWAPKFSVAFTRPSSS